MSAEIARKGKAEAAPKQEETDSYRREKKEKVPMKVSPIKKMDFPLSDDASKLGEPIVIIITAGAYSRELVIHRPVGVHKLQPDDWVLTPIAEIEPLLAMAEDPSAPKKAAAANKFRLDYLLSKGKYILKDKKVHYPDSVEGGVSLDEVKRATQVAYDYAKAEAREEYLRECAAADRKPKKDWKYGKALAAFLPNAVKVYEDGLKEFLRTDPGYAEGLKKLDPVPFETMAGQQQDRPQLPMKLRQPATRHQMVDQVHKHLVNTMTGGYAFPMVPPESLSKVLKSSGGDAAVASKTFMEALLGGPEPAKQTQTSNTSART